MFCLSVRTISRYLLLASFFSLGAASLNAQSKSQITAPLDAKPPRWDVFFGYSYFQSQGALYPNNIPYSNINVGGIVSGAFFINRYIGGEADIVVHHGTGNNGSDNDGFESASIGPVFRYPMGHFTPFIHVLAGGGHIVGPNSDNPATFEHEPWTWGKALTFGGGLDYETPLWNHRIGIRLIQVDWRDAHASFGTPYPGGVPVYGPPYLGGYAKLEGEDISAGIVLHPGYERWKAPATYSCAVTAPTGTIYPGDIVTITGTPGELNPKKTPSYTWAAEGIPVSGTSDVVSVDTKSLAPGTYTVHGHVAQGAKPFEIADCSTQFTVAPFAPPTVSCSANPSTVNPGDPSTITASGVSPQNRPLTYSYSTTAGTISGSGSTATLSTSGAAPGATITVTCDVVDDKAQTASSTATVMVSAPPPPPQVTASSLCSISFDRDARRPTRVDNEAKACLDDIALSAQRDPQAKLAVVGNAAAEEKMAEHKAAERAVNEKAYLVTEKGVDASRIAVYTGTAGTKSAATTIVPSGATLDTTGLTPVDETAVKVQPRTPLGTARHHHKKADAN